MRKNLLSCLAFLFLNNPSNHAQSVIILGTAQDGGRPQINCIKSCCAGLRNPDLVSSLGVVQDRRFYLFDATPDIAHQVNLIKQSTSQPGELAGIFLTHAHIGHYTGLMYLGREAMNSKEVPVYAMPLLSRFLQSNGPWGQLVALKNISIQTLQDRMPVVLENGLEVIPIKVPHRDEYSETVGFKIKGRKKSALYIPDIDKWNLWELSIVDQVRQVDYAFIDGTFFADGEINRPMSEVPHPFITETMEIFKNESAAVKNKIYFIHLNHSNPMNDIQNVQRKTLEKEGYSFARLGAEFRLD
jgi:pyrroloquinoline quinone biosynthesis protein B